MKNVAIAIIIAWLIVGSSCFAADTKFSNGRAAFESKLTTGQVVKALIQTSVLEAKSPIAGSFEWGGDETFHPKAYISSFRVIIDGNAVPVSLSAYEDLGDPYDVSFQEIGDAFQLSVRGGDAGVAYKATYIFKKIDGEIVLRSRKVVLLEFPDQAWEETTYSGPVKTD